MSNGLVRVTACVSPDQACLDGGDRLLDKAQRQVALGRAQGRRRVVAQLGCAGKGFNGARMVLLLLHHGAETEPVALRPRVDEAEEAECPLAPIELPLLKL